MSQDLHNLLKIPYDRLDEINAVLTNTEERVINEFLAVVEKYGTPEEINSKAAEARKMENLLVKVKELAPFKAKGKAEPLSVYNVTGLK